MNDYKYTPEKLYEATDNGLAIIHRYLPDSVGCERNKKHFKLRNERTPSATIFKRQECWMVKDFGSGEAFSPIQIFQRETGISDFHEALKALYSEFNVSENNTFYQPNKEFTDKGNKPDDYFFIKVKKKVENPQCFSEFVTAEICERYNVYEVEYYEKVTSEKKVLMRVNATENYPIFCYSDNLEKWAKTYCPAEKKRTLTKDDGTRETYNFKHGYLGKKPEKYYHGLTAIKQKVKELAQKQEDAMWSIEDETQGIKETSEDNTLIPYIVICSGGSDGLTVASLSDDFMPIWGNSENDIIDYETYEFLKKSCKNLVYLPDVDSSGINFAYDYSKVFWKLPIVFLPKYYLGEKGKDFRDFVSYFTKKEVEKSVIASEFKKLLSVPVSFEFVIVEDKRYRVNHRNLHYFLNAHNYFVHNDSLFSHLDNEDKGKLIHFEGFKVTVPEAQEVRNFCIDYCIRKGTNSKVLEILQTCNALRGADLKKLPSKEFNFTRHGKDFQLFFFQNMCVKVTADNVLNIKNKDVENFVFEGNIKKHDIRILQEPFFEHYQDEQGRNRVKILKDDFSFMNFLINGSRVFWKKEADSNKDFRKITLNSSFLSEDEQIVQEQHFLGKCFAIGYLLHKYNVSDFAKFVYVVDDEEKEGFLEANGGSGKSLMMKGIEYMVKFFDMESKKDDLLKGNHTFAGLTEEHDLVYFDDMTSQNDFTKLYPLITRGFFINPKGRDGYFLPFEKSPKLAGTFNYALKNTEQSTLRRILFVSFSSYYHAESQDYKEWQPSDDFHDRFFEEWNIATWNLFYNFMFRCLQLYLNNRKNPLLSPTGNVTKNNLKAVIGDSFLEWIQDYLQDEKFNIYITKDEMFDAFKSDMPRSTLTKPSFKKKIVNYCKLKGYEFNPEYIEGFQANGKRIVRFIYGKTQECFYIAKKQENNQKTNSQVSSNQVTNNQNPSNQKDIDVDGIDF
ncbi:hypothetical protein [Capnocytophaga cynodegmi]|uniref:Uncharacterized protein n=1 Tax=Capnocytophaga cynodegmi TaxID=28189 RepID=A0A0B7HBD9_9FLAO|nr:hypothetical protein [Capnocytophaga cynodegmi]CEN34933.1 conserved hypothetical protein [Capnocytophaga cynodegmi]